MLTYLQRVLAVWVICHHREAGGKSSEPSTTAGRSWVSVLPARGERGECCFVTVEMSQQTLNEIAGGAPPSPNGRFRNIDFGFQKIFHPTAKKYEMRVRVRVPILGFATYLEPKIEIPFKWRSFEGGAGHAPRLKFSFRSSIMRATGSALLAWARRQGVRLRPLLGQMARAPPTLMSRPQPP